MSLPPRQPDTLTSPLQLDNVETLSNTLTETLSSESDSAAVRAAVEAFHATMQRMNTLVREREKDQSLKYEYLAPVNVAASIAVWSHK